MKGVQRLHTNFQHIFLKRNFFARDSYIQVFDHEEIQIPSIATKIEQKVLIRIPIHTIKFYHVD